uniref:FYVE-type domain-containing protein n=1 Tax=Phytophthora ramorum TaxID=164328 RepID=H3GXP5_PHYRM
MADFPLPRAMLPTLSVRAETHKSATLMMGKLLEHTIREFEQLSYTRNGVVNTNQWRALSRAQASQNGQQDGQVKVYSERDCGETSTDLAYTLQDSTFAALPPSAVLVAGRAPGTVDNVMYALGGAHTQEGLALFAGFMYDDVADCGVLHALETDDNLYDRNSSRVLQSVRYIFRQKSERIMEVFMLGNLQLAGVLNVGGVGVGGSNGAGGGDLFSISKLQQCAEIRRLTLMACRRPESIGLLQMSSHHNTECCLCRRTKRFFTGAMFAECDVCGQLVCSKCRNYKKLFVRDGLLGRFQRAQTCKTCALAASAGYASPSRYLSVAQQMTKSHAPGKTRSVDRRRSSSRDSSVDTRSESSLTSSEFYSYGQGSVSMLSEAAEEDFRESQHPQDTSQTTANSALSSQMLGYLNDHRGPRPGPMKRGTSNASSVDSTSSRDRIYLTPPTPSKLYVEEGKQRKTGHQHRRDHQHHQLEPREPQRRPKHNHQATNQLDCANLHSQLVRTTLDHSDLSGHELAMSYSGPSSAIVEKTLPESAYSIQRTVSAPGNSSRSDLMAQMMELNMKAENTYHATQRNGVLLKHQIRTRPW